MHCASLQRILKTDIHWLTYLSLLVQGTYILILIVINTLYIRNCIGQEFALHEEKVALATILRHYEITVDENYTVKPKRVLLLQPENGLHLKLKKRQFI